MTAALTESIDQIKYENPEIIGYPNRGPALSTAELVRQLNTLPDGARATVFIQLEKNKGHTIICEREQGQIKFIDPQNNSQNAAMLINLFDKFGYFRMDNLTIKKDFDLTLIVQSDTIRKNSVYVNAAGGSAMVLEEALEIFKNNWWKRYKTAEHESYEITVEEVLEVHEHCVVLVAAIVKKGTQPVENDFDIWQIDDDGDCGVLIQG